MAAWARISLWKFLTKRVGGTIMGAIGLIWFSPVNHALYYGAIDE